MAVKTKGASTPNETVAAAGVVQTPTQPVPPPVQMSEQKENIQAPRLTSILKDFVRVSGLDASAEAYFNRLSQVVTAAAKTKQIGIEISQAVTQNATGYVFRNTAKHCIVLVAATSCTLLDHQTPADTAQSFYDYLRAADDENKMIKFIVVSPEDYDRVDVMAAAVVNLFLTSDADKYKIDVFSKCNYTIITRKDRVDEFMRTLSPHGVPARSDYGFVVCINEGYRRNASGAMEPQLEPIAGVSAYTRFLTQSETAQYGLAAERRFIPIVTITDIISRIPHKSMLPLLLSIAARTFIAQAGWQRQFQTFVKDQPNLGSLLSDPNTGVPWTIENREQLNQFITQYVAPAMLGVDISVGRASIADIDVLVNEAQNSDGSLSANEYFRTFGPGFLRVPRKEDGKLPFLPKAYLWGAWNVHGVYSDGGMIKDTRCIDYLSLVPKVNNNTASIRPLLSQSNSRDWFLDYVKKNIYTENVRAIYNIASVVLNNDFVRMLVDGLNTCGITINDDIGVATEIALNPLMTNIKPLNDITLGQSNIIGFQASNLYTNW